jgi:hypothetical protein
VGGGKVIEVEVGAEDEEAAVATMGADEEEDGAAAVPAARTGLADDAAVRALAAPKRSRLLRED